MKNIPKLVNYIRNYLHITDCYRPTPTDDSGGINISSYKDLPIRILYILILRIFFYDDQVQKYVKPCQRKFRSSNLQMTL